MRKIIVAAILVAGISASQEYAEGLRYAKADDHQNPDGIGARDTSTVGPGENATYFREYDLSGCTFNIPYYERNKEVPAGQEGWRALKFKDPGAVRLKAGAGSLGVATIENISSDRVRIKSVYPSDIILAPGQITSLQFTALSPALTADIVTGENGFTPIEDASKYLRFTYCKTVLSDVEEDHIISLGLPNPKK